MTPRDLERFVGKIGPRDAITGCNLWCGTKQNRGYGFFYAKVEGRRTTLLAHRVAYEQFVGPIPEGLQIDHLCRTRLCVNVEHMEVVTPMENTRRGASGVLRVRKTHCPQGHPYEPGNIYYRRETGYKRCRACVLEKCRIRWRTRREA